MRHVDLTPLMRATVGFDRMMNLLDSAGGIDDATAGYPPYNIEKTGEDTYRITMAMAGFGEDDLEVTVKEASLVIKAAKAKDEDAKETKYLHRGIATRSFERRFDLADHIRVAGAKLENGLLAVELKREVPEALKPRSIKIEALGAGKPKVIENVAA